MEKIKRRLTNILFELFIYIFKRKPIREKIEIKSSPKILIIHFGNLQQSLLVTPLLQQLKKISNGVITVLADKNNYQIFESNIYLEKSLLFETGYKKQLHQLIKLYRENFDVIIDPHEILSIKSSVFIGLLNAKYKIGYIKGNEKLFTHSLALLNYNKTHVVDRILHLADPFGNEQNKTDLNIFYKTSARTEEIIEAYYIKHDLSYKFTTLINISNNSKLGFWGIENYKLLLKYLKNYDINVLILASIDDIEIAEKIANPKNLIFYNTDFDIYAEMIKKSNFVFSPDSFTVQLASAYKIPIFCLFVQNNTVEIINVPYNSDFDFALTEKNSLKNISYGKVLHSFIPYFEYVYEKFNQKS